MGGSRVQVVLRVLSRAGQVCGALAILVVLVAGPAAAQTTAPTAPPGPPSVKYFVVPHADNPNDVTLFKIAERALGDGNRFPEIFELNKGRPRPDGTPFNDAAAIQPGQVLQLPDDAVDPGVKFGPLPTVTPPPAPPKATTPTAAPAGGTSGLTVGLASVVSGAGGVLVGLLGGIWWRRLPRIIPPPAFEPADDRDFESHSGTLPIPVVLPRQRPDSLPGLLRQEPITAGHSFVFLDTADTQVIAAIRPGSRFRFTLGNGGAPGVVDTIAGSSTTLVVDGESESESEPEGNRP